jgi:hypothetical protein
MEAMPRPTWTEERLDDLAHRVDEGFNRVHEDMRALRTEMNVRLDTQQQATISRFDASQQAMNARFDAMQRLLIQVGGGMFAALVGLIATQL